MIQVINGQGQVVLTRVYRSPEEALSAYGRMVLVGQGTYTVLVEV